MKQAARERKPWLGLKVGSPGYRMAVATAVGKCAVWRRPQDKAIIRACRGCRGLIIYVQKPERDPRSVVLAKGEKPMPYCVSCYPKVNAKRREQRNRRRSGGALFSQSTGVLFI